MTIITADDEELALSMLTEAVGEALPQAEVHAFRKASAALEFIGEAPCDIAFLDIEMRDMNGIELAKRLKEIAPAINIVFVTGYSSYMGQAFDLYASGYVLKPVTKHDVEREVENLRHPVDPKATKRLYVQMFGSFEVFHFGKPLSFSRTKTKELFAYLVSRRGAECSNTEVAAVLWEDRPDSRALQSHLRNLVSDLVGVLGAIDCADALIKKRGSLAVATDRIACDFYDFTRGDTQAVNSYAGEFMSQYSWAEFTNGYLKQAE